MKSFPERLIKAVPYGLIVTFISLYCEYILPSETLPRSARRDGFGARERRRRLHERGSEREATVRFHTRSLFLVHTDGVEFLETQIPDAFDAGRSYVEATWRFVFEDLCESSLSKTLVATNVWGMVVYWVFGSMYLALDVFAPKFILKYKTQDSEPNAPVDPKRLASAIRRVLFNQIVVGSALGLVIGSQVMKRMSFQVDEIPPLKVFVKHLAGYCVAEEIGFYSAHWLSHQKPFYAKIHKIHHEWTAPIAITARYAHWTEDVLANMLPVAAGPFLMRSHIFFFWVWIFVALTSTLTSHSGYHLPFLASSEGHDAHHLLFNVNFSAFGVLDTLFDTKHEPTTIQAKRDHVLVGFRSAREKHPAPEKKTKKRL